MSNHTTEMCLGYALRHHWYTFGLLEITKLNTPLPLWSKNAPLVLSKFRRAYLGIRLHALLYRQVGPPEFWEHKWGIFGPQGEGGVQLCNY